MLPRHRNLRLTAGRWLGSLLLAGGVAGLLGLAGCETGPLVSSTPGMPPGPPLWVQVSAGFNHTLAIKADGTLWAWGDSAATACELGDGTCQPHPQPTQVDPARNWAQVAAGTQYSLALKADGTLWGWGLNSVGQVGDNTAPATRPTPVQITPGTTYKAIAAGDSNALAIKSDDTLWGWGGNVSGEIGDGTVIQRNAPVLVDAPNTYAAISAGGTHSLAIRKGTGKLYAWGDGSLFQLGTGTAPGPCPPTCQTTPLAVEVAQTYSAIAAGSQFSLGIRSTPGMAGTLWGWGLNLNGQIGDNTTVNKPNPTQEFTLAANWIQVVASSGATVARQANGSLWAWGINVVGEVGDGTLIDKHVPTREFTLGMNWSAASSGSSGYTFGLRSDGSLWGWGANGSGQLGDRTLTGKLQPTQIP